MFGHLKSFFQNVKLDYRNYREEYKSSFFGAILSPGYIIMFCFRSRALLAVIPVIGYLVRIIFYFLFKIFFSIELRYGATVKGTLILPHPQSIVIGKGTVFVGTCWVYQGVTVGTFGRHQYPTIESSVLGVNSILLGNISVPKGSIVKANSIHYQRID